MEKYNRSTYCKNGHELSGDNLIQIYKKNGTKNGRRCRICLNNKVREYKRQWAAKDYAKSPEKYREAGRRYREKILNEKSYVAKQPKTHCARGHELTEENSYSWISKQGKKLIRCKVCTKNEYERRALQLRDNHLQKKFGIILQQFDEMLILQDGKCALCGTTDPRGNGAFHVDHCHLTGKIRKLLCSECNTCLGKVNDDPNLLRKMADYIDYHNNLLSLDESIFSNK